MNKLMKATILAVVTSILLVGTVVATTVMGTPPNQVVLICEADKNAVWLGVSYPYWPAWSAKLIDASGKITVNTGPIWSEGATAWGDIIPSYTYQPDPNKPAVTFPGQNWTEYGKSIFENNCLVK